MIDIRFNKKDIKKIIDEKAEEFRKEMVKEQNRALNRAYRKGAKILEDEYGLPKGKRSDKDRSASFGGLTHTKRASDTHISALLYGSTRGMDPTPFIEGGSEPRKQKNILLESREKIQVKKGRRKERFPRGFTIRKKQPGDFVFLNRINKNKVEKARWPSVFDVLTEPKNLKAIQKAAMD